MRRTLYTVATVSVFTMISIVACSNNNKSLSSESTSSLGAKTETASTLEKDTDAENTYGWGDNAGGRRVYTIDEINNGLLGDTIVFNSVKDDDSTLSEEERAEGITTPLTDERSFIGIRDVATGNKGKGNVWNIGKVTIEEGKTYIVRMYIHNNNPKGMNAVAKDVTAQFILQDHLTNNEARISGIISSSNAGPSRIWHTLLLKSDDNRPFTLNYVKDSALLENNIFKDGISLSDDLVSDGIKVGYEKFDGNLPGCYEYACYLTFKVQPVFD